MDELVTLHDISWTDFERILEDKGDRSVPRVAYVDGTLQLLTPGYPHERIATTIARLVETWCLERDVEFTSVGHLTVKNKAKGRGVEPDACWILGPPRGETETPDLAIEVIWTSGSIDKLNVYRKLGVAEVWIWRRDELKMYVLHGEHYEETAESEQLPGIDPAQLTSVLDQPTTSAAIRAYRELLHK